MPKIIGLNINRSDIKNGFAMLVLKYDQCILFSKHIYNTLLMHTVTGKHITQ